LGRGKIVQRSLKGTVFEPNAECDEYHLKTEDGKIYKMSTFLKGMDGFFVSLSAIRLTQEISRSGL